MSYAFLVTSLVIVATPGTGVLFTVSAGLARGREAGAVAAFGCTLGILPHLAAAVTGTAAVLRAGGIAFELVRVLGVAYLLYMAWATWRDKTGLTVDSARAPASARKVVVSAILVNLLNPKLTIFFFAFLPQFVRADASGQLPQMLMLSGVFMGMTFVVFTVYGMAAAAARHHLIDRPRITDRLRRLFAASFIALAARLAATTR